MTERPHLTPNKEAERTTRTERLAKALRENLRRRKEQARAQEQGEGERSKPSRGGEPTA